jgi:hypothetical protein
MLLNPSRHALSLIKGFLLLTLACCGTAWAYDDYSGCASCHGDFASGTYQSNHDGASWGTNLMDAHTTWVGGECQACHQSSLSADVLLNQSADGTFSKSCVGCHGRDEDVTGSCVGDNSPVECGSGAGLRETHESNVGAGTCSNCHTGDAAPVGEDIQPFNYSLQASTIADACDADGSESRFGLTGLDNDGDGQRDADDSDCGQFSINAGMNDAWYNPATNGQGFLITVFEDTGLVFLAWFTYDVERPPEDVTAILGDPGHRWVTAQGPYAGDTATLDVAVSSGGVFDSPEPAVPPAVSVGTITIKWNDCTSATLTYNIESAGQGEIPLQRIVPDNVPLCESL